MSSSTPLGRYVEGEINETRRDNMGTLEKITFGILGVGIAAGVAYLTVELSKTHPTAAKTVVDGISKVGDLAADKISDNPNDKPIVEGLKSGKDFLAETAKGKLDERHNQNNRWQLYGG